MKPINLLAGLSLLIYFNDAAAQSYEIAFQNRVNQIVNRLADTAAIKANPGYFVQEFSGPGSKPDPEKHVWPVVIARLKKYGNSDTCANRLLAKYKNRSPFHFTYVGMARIICEFGNATNMLAFKQTYLQQVWNRTDSYNPWTGEGTENHINMNKTSGYLYAQKSLGNPGFPNASSKIAELKTWLKWYSKNLYSKGNSEWNSSSYESYNLVGWLNLFDFAEDPEVRKIARAVLDYFACEIALHSSQGLTGGAESRGNITSWGSGEDYISWIWFGNQGRLMGTNFWINSEYSQAVHAAVSTYRPPNLLIKIARKEISVPALFQTSRPDYNQNTASFVKQYFYVDKGFTIGSAMIPVNGFSGGNSQFCNWKLVGKIKPSANQNPQVVTGGSRFYGATDGKGKTPWDQYVQHENVLIQFNKISSVANEIINKDTLLFTNPVTGWKAKWQSDFYQRFPNDIARRNPVGFQKGSISKNISYLTFPKNSPRGNAIATQFKSNIFFIELDSTFLAIRSISSIQPSSPASDGTLRYCVEDNALQGALCGLITEAGNWIDYSSFSAFQDSVVKKTSLDKSLISNNKIIYKNLKGRVLEAIFTENGPTSSEPLYDWGFGATSQQLFQSTPPFLQPNWQDGIGRGRIPELYVDGQDVGYKLNKWPIYNGPGLSLDESRLLLSKDSSDLRVFYEINYSGDLPVFNSGILLTSNKLFQNGNEEPLELFPNPASHEVMVKAKGISIGESLETLVFSVNGALVWNRKDLIYTKEGLTIPASSLTIGTYQVIVKTRNKKFAGRLILSR